MKISLIAVGSRMPQWVELGVAEYRKRITREFGFSILEIPMARRSKSSSIARCVQQEGVAMLNKLKPDDYVVALHIEGRVIDTPGLAARLQAFRENGDDVALLVGGPDGLAPACLDRAQEQWSLSALTLPHPLVRVLISEQLYRAVSIAGGHPYHRA